MSGLALRSTIPAMLPEAIDLVCRIESENLQRPQTDLGFEHHLHAGLYARTMCVPDMPDDECCLITGAFIVIPTLLISNGEALVYMGDDEPFRLTGYHVIQAEAGRKQAFLARGGYRLTMIFATSARTVEDAEEEFTNEAYRLQSRRL